MYVWRGIYLNWNVLEENNLDFLGLGVFFEEEKI